MRNLLADWFEDRTGVPGRLRSMREEPLPSGLRWRYVCGSALLSILLIQAFTGLMMMTAYSASSSTAWGSVYYIQYRMDFGWFIRGLHHFGSQTMVVLLGLHMLQVVIAGAQLPPREVNW